jgi:hypothetical protein
MIETPKKRKSKKHPKDMTTEEAIRHVLHPTVVKHLKIKVKELNRASTKPE